ncbi:subtilisin-like protease (plasmid) [Streptomyces clavuligerus]|uniref:Subtilisin-like protease n=1 Tax=Streptomyces clavuligerus TaxID=1901 RepID=D5SJZ4_STRCL|nr:subtilisin-like protease [Streptomyces clavuligerus]
MAPSDGASHHLGMPSALHASGPEGAGVRRQDQPGGTARAAARWGVTLSTVLALAMGLAPGGSTAVAAPSYGTGTGTGTGTGADTEVRSVTLGDGGRITTSANGRALSHEPAEGRAQGPLMLQTSSATGGRVHALSLDAARDITAGRQDARRYDITELTGRQTAASGGTTAAERTGRDRTPEAAPKPGRKPVTHTLTIDFIGRDGAPSRDFASRIQGFSGAATGIFPPVDASSGTATLQVPPGRYGLEAIRRDHPSDPKAATDVLIQPWLEVTGDTRVTVDARTTRPTRLTPPDPRATHVMSELNYRVTVGEHYMGFAMSSRTADIRTAHIGPEVTDGSLTQAWTAMWAQGTTDYNLALGEVESRRLVTGKTRHFTDGELATVRTRAGLSGADGAQGEISAVGVTPGRMFPMVPIRELPLPTTRTQRLSTVPGTSWALGTKQRQALPGSPPWAREASYSTPLREYAPGSHRVETFNTGVFSPLLGDDRDGVTRDGNVLQGSLPLLADGAGHRGGSALSSARTTLHRDGVLIGENDDPLSGAPGRGFTVPPGDASYTLATSVTRDPAVARAASRMDASWTFRSRETTAPERLPVSVARFHTPVDLRSTAPAGARQHVAVGLQGPAARPGNLASLTVDVSYDGGATWKSTPVTDRRFQVVNPAAGKGISFRATFTDRGGNKGTVTVVDAYHGR